MTHVYFDSDKIDWDSYLGSQQVGQGFRMTGRGIPGNESSNDFFRGQRYVRGYGAGSMIKGALGSLGRFLLPIATNIMESAGREADETLGRIHQDIGQGQPLLGAIKEQSRKGLSNIGQKIQQCGKGKKSGNKNKTISISSNPNTMVKRKRRYDYLDV